MRRCGKSSFLFRGLSSSTPFLLGPSALRLSLSLSSIRNYSTLPVTEALVARYSRHGNPENVLKLETEKLPSSLQPNEILVQMMMAPINPADLNMIEGVYPIQPPIPAIAGNEGVAEIVEVGSDVKNMTKGDWVIPAQAGFGTWRNYAVTRADNMLKVPQDIKAEYAACIFVNPGTAYRLLKDFVDLKQGDVIIQNGGTSAVGLAVCQLAHLRGIKVITVFRDSPDSPAMMSRLKSNGSYLVVKEDDLLTPMFADLMHDIPKPKLALNCIGGISATNIARLLDDNGIMVTYGGMSRKPLQIPTSLFIFKNIQLKGFWLSKWVDEHTVNERMAMVKELWQLVREKKLRMYLERYMLKDLSAGLKRSTTQFRARKTVLVMKPHEGEHREDE